MKKLEQKDRAFRHAGVSYLDYKHIEMDRVLTAFLARLWWDGQGNVIPRSGDLGAEKYVGLMDKNPDAFEGFDPVIARRWVETHLLDVVNRGTPREAVAGLRPLHGFTYRFRNARRSRAYGADEQLYEMLVHAGRPGEVALARLKSFFFAGVDARTHMALADDDTDVETQALISLSNAVRVGDRASGDRRRSYPPLYPEAANLLADDVIRLLRHRELIPRTVLVDYLKILFAFHLARYHLISMKALPAAVGEGKVPAPAAEFFLDVTGLPETGAAGLAARSAAAWYARIPDFVSATFTIRKLDDFAEQLMKRGAIPRPAGGFCQVSDLLALLGPRRRKERNAYAEARLSAIDAAGAPGADEDDDPVVTQLLQLGLDPFTAYVEVITHYRVKFHHQYLRECLDSLLLKNKPGAMIAQPRSGERRFTLDSRLLEVLLQLALLRPPAGRPHDLATTPLRVDEFLGILHDRYGLCVDRLPAGDGFGPAIVTDHAALRENRAAFVARLREIGFYSDLSDAYLTQTITPRYTIEAGT